MSLYPCPSDMSLLPSLREEAWYYQEQAHRKTSLAECEDAREDLLASKQFFVFFTGECDLDVFEAMHTAFRAGDEAEAGRLIRAAFEAFTDDVLDDICHGIERYDFRQGRNPQQTPADLARQFTR